MNTKNFMDFLEKNSDSNLNLLNSFKDEIKERSKDRGIFTTSKFSTGDQLVKIDEFENIVGVYNVSLVKKGVYLLFAYDSDYKRHHVLETEEGIQNKYHYFSLDDYARGKISPYLDICLYKFPLRKEYVMKQRHGTGKAILTFEDPFALLNKLITFSKENIAPSIFVIKDFKRGFFLVESANEGVAYMLTPKYIEKHATLFKTSSKFLILNY